MPHSLRVCEHWHNVKVPCKTNTVQCQITCSSTKPTHNVENPIDKTQCIHKYYTINNVGVPWKTSTVCVYVSTKTLRCPVNGVLNQFTSMDFYLLWYNLLLIDLITLLIFHEKNFWNHEILLKHKDMNGNIEIRQIYSCKNSLQTYLPSWSAQSTSAPIFNKRSTTSTFLQISTHS